MVISIFEGNLIFYQKNRQRQGEGRKDRKKGRNGEREEEKQLIY
jgi:hypothetical protein